jgi:23S rRNA pseudouridine1911/1915/1917 synthase
MSHEREIVVPAGKKKERLDTFLTHHIENATRTKVQRAIKQGAVLINGKSARSSHQVSPGEIIHITLPKPPPRKALPENIPLDIFFEDDDIIVVNKPAGMVTHPAHGNYSGTLVNAVLHHCGQIASFTDAVRPGIVHRLDKDTSGLMVIAKTESAHAKLAKQFAARTVKREYWALVWGKFKHQKGVIEAGLGRSKSDRKKMAVVANGKTAVTEYEIVEEFEYLSLVRLKLRTGRTHQIRVHLAHIHHPVFGDPTYGGRQFVAGKGTLRQRSESRALLQFINRQALHAKTLGFVHPSTQQDVFFDSAIPSDFSLVLATLRAV